MKKTEYVIKFITINSSGYRRVYEDENGDHFVKIKGEIVSVLNPMFAWSKYEYLPYNRKSV